MQMMAIGQYAKRISDKKRNTKSFNRSYNSFKLKKFKPLGANRVK